MRKVLVLLLLPLAVLGQKFTATEIVDWRKRAQGITIVRDNWGVAHVYGKTDADAVFGMLYAQCEDDFPRVEMNYITAVARLAEVEGEAKLYNDLRVRLLYDTLEAIDNYKKAEPWLKSLCSAFADGVNYYLHTHPQIKPKLLTRFQPWMPFLFSEGSIGGDIEAISLTKLKDFYGTGNSPNTKEEIDLDNGGAAEPGGSNGFAIAPSRSASGNALLMINPHTSFYFRPEIHVNSEEGLNSYGAVTWGQFFIYQGFNEHCGWMHTSGQADAIDEYREAIVKKKDGIFYRYGTEERTVQSKKIKLAYKNGNKKSFREFIVYYTHHGPVIGKDEYELWTSIRLMKEPVKALTQSFLRTKAKGFDEFKKTMELKTNSSNNTVFADSKGNIAYWHGNFIPKRNPAFDWSKPVDGSNPATEWGNLHLLDEIVHLYNPLNGWIQNCNSTPFTAAGPNSPKKEDFPTYMAPDSENPRGWNAVRVMDREKRFTLDGLISAAYDPYLIGFEDLIPIFKMAYQSANDSVKTKLHEPFEVINAWDLKRSNESVATTLAIYWGQELRQQIFAKRPSVSGQAELIQLMIAESSPEEKLAAFAKVVDELMRDFGTWKVGWGEVNRFQRLTGEINETYDDNKPSTPVPFASSFWGSLASFGSRKAPNTKKMYGNGGNSFVAAVEFGPRIKAKSILAGGVSNNPKSPYFTNQAQRYSEGNFKDVAFYREDVTKEAVKTYHPGGE